MNCRDAEFFLRFRRPGLPGAGELAPKDAAALDQHLAGCSLCAAQDRASSAFDTTIGTAMRAVAIPAGLRERLIARNSAERGAVIRRRTYLAAALAASLFLTIGLAAGIFSASRPQPNIELLADRAAGLESAMHFVAAQVDPVQAQTNENDVRRWLKAEGLPEELPENFDFSLVLSYHWEEVQGRKVPVILFRGRDQGFAKVYAFRETQFNLKGMKHAQNSTCQAIVYETNRRPGLTFVVVFTGRDLEPFLKGLGAGGPVALRG